MKIKLLAMFSTVLVLTFLAGSTLALADSKEEAIAQTSLQFSALNGIQAEPMSNTEMSKVEGKGLSSVSKSVLKSLIINPAAKYLDYAA
ncbi:MAG: hypothetical protein HZC51_10185 [Nitrospirae bacterium]|nr:hypothetical protein [Nitrospirota bacterium]